MLGDARAAATPLLALHPPFAAGVVAEGDVVVGRCGVGPHDLVEVRVPVGVSVGVRVAPAPPVIAEFSAATAVAPSLVCRPRLVLVEMRRRWPRRYRAECEVATVLRIKRVRTVPQKGRQRKYRKRKKGVQHEME